MYFSRNQHFIFMEAKKKKMLTVLKEKIAFSDFSFRSFLINMELKNKIANFKGFTKLLTYSYEFKRKRSFDLAQNLCSCKHDFQRMHDNLTIENKFQMIDTSAKI